MGIFATITVVMSFLALQISFGIYDEELYGKSLQELEFFTQKVNDNMDDIEAMSFEIAMNQDIQLKLNEINALKLEDKGYEYQLHQLRSMFVDQFDDIAGIQNIIYTDTEDVSFLIGADRGLAEKEIYEALIESYHKARGGYVYFPPSMDYPYMISGRDLLQRVPQITLNNMGSIFITSDIGGVISKEKSYLEATNSHLSVSSENGAVYEEEMSIPIGVESLTATQGYNIIKVDGEKYF